MRNTIASTARLAVTAVLSFAGNPRLGLMLGVTGWISGTLACAAVRPVADFGNWGSFGRGETIRVLNSVTSK